MCSGSWGAAQVETGALVLASFRDDELDRAVQLRLVLGDLAGSAVRLKIAPLSAAAVMELSAPHGLDARDFIARRPESVLCDRGPRRPGRGDSGERPRRGAGTGGALFWRGERAAGGRRNCAGRGRGVVA